MNSTDLAHEVTTIDGSSVRPVRRRAVLAASALGAAWIGGLVGCVAPANDRLSVNNIETLDMNVGVQERVTQYVPLATIARREWSPLTYVVPVDSVVHGPTYATTIELTSNSARERGAYPTVSTVFELSEGSQDEQAVEGIIGPFVGLAQGLATIVLVFIDPPTHGDESPMMAYQRRGPEAALRPAINELVSEEATGGEQGGETER